MSPRPDSLARPQAPAVLTLAGLRQFQLKLAALSPPVGATLDMPLSRAAGRVLAQDLPAADAASVPLLPRGTRLEARHLPLLAAVGHPTACVLARPRVGVMALLDEEAAPAGRRSDALAGAAWVSATVERVGAQAFEAACRAPCPQRFVEKLEMFVDECELVITIGFLSPALCDAVRQAQVRRGQPALVEALRPRPLGALQVMRLGKALVVAISADLESAVATFTTLLTPVIRRLQGRGETLPDVRAAELDDLWRGDYAPWQLLPVRVDPGALNTRVVLRLCEGDDAATRLAGADGLAWHAAEFSAFDRPTVGWFPFETWAA